ncbi:MAG: protein-L-isoaspartate(D-aspartate) O-methyltransferase [Sphingobacteriales bacterium]|jgi:protein-L-isoaspartate(D-aspartate) O-methyltransferase|nr:protein-L-isoaspartate(D-aspartate) O-methyltransferase [Sphingobacteriales bacterium]
MAFSRMLFVVPYTRHVLLHPMIQDSLRHEGLRRQLVDDLKSKGITSPVVLDAISQVPRHAFLDNAFLAFAYQDKAFPIACEQTISQPSTVAFQTQLLDPKPGEKVLEIGTGSGYQTAVLVETGVKVYSVERHKPLHDSTQRLLNEILALLTDRNGLKRRHAPRLFFGDGFKGLPAFAPFDKIIVTCGAPAIPMALFEQLKPGGLMVIPVGVGAVQTMITVLKRPDGTMEQIAFSDCRFVPMLSDKVR